MNIMDGDISNPINMLEEYAGNSNARINIIMIHNVESIPVNELRRLNFLFRVTDKSYIYANIVILLLWNTQERPFTDEERRLYGVVDDGETESNDVGTSISLQSFLSAEWSKSGPDVSGRALSGRITRIAFSAKEDLTSRVSMALSCSAIRDDVAERKQARENDCTMVNKIKRSVRASTGPVNWLLSRMMDTQISIFVFSLIILQMVLLIAAWLCSLPRRLKKANANEKGILTGGADDAFFKAADETPNSTEIPEQNTTNDDIDIMHVKDVHTVSNTGCQAMENIQNVEILEDNTNNSQNVPIQHQSNGANEILLH